MHIGPNDLINTETPLNNALPTTASQHGLLSNQQSLADSGDGRHEDPYESAASIASAGRSFADAEEQLSRLSVSDKVKSRSKPSYQQISEYEGALSPSPKTSMEGPVFKVVKTKGNRLDTVHLGDFPNEVLTHILSHLPANSLSAVTLVSHRFYELVTTPHAWRTAFSRFFPGQDSTSEAIEEQNGREILRSERRYFTRLTALASWRSEYILRTRLLRSLGRGKPSKVETGHGASSRSNSAANNANAVVTYSSQLFSTINHIHAVFNTGNKATRFIHGTHETGSACTSDPSIGKIDNWGLSDPQALLQFSELFVGDAPYGMGDGPAGLPNSMDVSQPYGMIYGEGFPGGNTYFRSTEEMRGRFLGVQSEPLIDHGSGIPRIPRLTEATSSVWIAKCNNVPLTTNGLVGMISGSTLGVVSAYSLGADTPHGRRIQRGQLTSRWVVCPGVPIIQIKVDESYNASRKSAGRIWAVVLNALGEVYYLTNTPTSAISASKVEITDAERHAWNAGRTAYFHLAECSRRFAKEDLYHEHDVHGSYSPRSSEVAMGLSKAQITAETREVEKYLMYSPTHFRQSCLGWDMRRRLEVDFAGSDGSGAGEGIIVVQCALEEGVNVEAKRFTRWRTEQASLQEYPLPKTPPMASKSVSMASLFGCGNVITSARNTSPDPSTAPSAGVVKPSIAPGSRSPSLPGNSSGRKRAASFVEEWRTSIFSLSDQAIGKVTASSIDMSTFALLTVDEDPILTVNVNSTVSSPFATRSDNGNALPVPIPGQRARFLAIGSGTGKVVVFNMRGPQPDNAIIVNELSALRTIQTDSPQISCLAVSSMYLVHGGNDGLVQAWDPLASSLQPIRVLHSRFSSRARRRLVQAEASVQGVGINLYAAGALMLDPDPTVLRGMVSLGTHLRYWSYSASAADQYQSKKRRLRRSNERGTNSGPDRFTNTGRGALLDYIATEQEDLKKEKLRRAKEDARLRGRFGVGLGGLSDEDAIRYAEMISAEEFQKDEERRISEAGYLADSALQSACSSSTVTPVGSYKDGSSLPCKDEQFDEDIEEAIRLSLLDGVDSGGRSPRRSGSGGYDIPITYKQKKVRRSASSSPSTSKLSRHRAAASPLGSSKHAVAADDLEHALQLSLAEEASRTVFGVVEEEFPSLNSPICGKGKGRAR
ncbi:putative F-box/WD repeat-containing protein pof10 [Calycina marina]|uniref:F-box/WD repeat-containing protein pof10 n=1 Tax=Calycina marina TaxID=1763456 RepID=A0A9P8CIC3_9HELO|nr:putative F-box/WD repeat-containing protein pof10 [Calycina marina]